LFNAEGRTDGQTDKHIYKGNSCFWIFCERVSNGPKYSTETFDAIRRTNDQIMQSNSDRLTILKDLHLQNFTKESSDSHFYSAIMQSFSTFFCRHSFFRMCFQ